jgi:hypothetical protein
MQGYLKKALEKKCDPDKYFEDWSHDIRRQMNENFEIIP